MLVAHQKIPVQRGKRTGVCAGTFARIIAASGAVVAHAIDIVARRTIGLAADYAAIAVLTHAQHVRE